MSYSLFSMDETDMKIQNLFNKYNIEDRDPTHLTSYVPTVVRQRRFIDELRKILENDPNPDKRYIYHEYYNIITTTKPTILPPNIKYTYETEEHTFIPEYDPDSTETVEQVFKKYKIKKKDLLTIIDNKYEVPRSFYYDMRDALEREKNRPFGKKNRDIIDTRLKSIALSDPSIMRGDIGFIKPFRTAHQPRRKKVVMVPGKQV